MGNRATETVTVSSHVVILLTHAGRAGACPARPVPRPKAPLVWLLVASIAPDILDGVYALARVCSPYGVYSHSLPAIAVLAAITMVLAYAGTRSGAIALVFGLVVLAHVPLDWLTGEKALWLHRPVVGLNLYRWPAVDFVLELPLIVGGWWMLRRVPGAPRWAISGAALALLLLGQIVADSSFTFTKRLGTTAHKNACGVAYQLDAPR
jgi:membrane-bound metal-dependent hydrolase YbcI (DUF457 family)